MNTQNELPDGSSWARVGAAALAVTGAGKTMLMFLTGQRQSYADQLKFALDQQQKLGIDLSGKAGGALFTVPSAVVVSGSANTGSATPALSISDPTRLQASDYQVTYNNPPGGSGVGTFTVTHTG